LTVPLNDMHHLPIGDLSTTVLAKCWRISNEFLGLETAVATNYPIPRNNRTWHQLSNSYVSEYLLAESVDAYALANDACLDCMPA